jgi:hypothetical protein
MIIVSVFLLGYICALVVANSIHKKMDADMVNLIIKQIKELR